MGNTTQVKIDFTGLFPSLFPRPDIPRSPSPSPRPEIPNMRVSREPSPWVVQGTSLSARIEATSAVFPNFETASWILKVQLNSPMATHSIAGVRVVGSNAVLLFSKQDQGGKVWNLSLDAVAPTKCSVDNPREPIELEVFFADKKIPSEKIIVDYSCMLGEFVHTPDAENFGKIASKFVSQGLIPELVKERAPAKRDAAADLAWLKQRTHFAEALVKADPLDAAKDWRAGQAYALRPDDTVRYGGDCEDWSIVGASFFSGLGYRVRIVDATVHVWWQVWVDGKWQGMDLVNDWQDQEPFRAYEIAN